MEKYSVKLNNIKIPKNSNYRDLNYLDLSVFDDTAKIHLSTCKENLII